MDQNYSILITVSFLDVEETFDIYVPTTKTIAYLINLLQKFIKENINPKYQINNAAMLINSRTGEEYDPNKLVIDSSLRNGTRVALY